MVALVWDAVGERYYERGADHGVLYVQNTDGSYADGVAWNGLTTVTESPSGAESTPVYADNIEYLNLKSIEKFGATIEALTYPPEFALCLGRVAAEPGVYVGQQSRRSFGFVWRTLIGSDTDEDLGYKLHIAWGCSAAPSEQAHNTVNESPEATPLSWTVTSVATALAGFKPTAKLTIDSTEVDATALAALEDTLFGSGGGDATLPTPDEVIALFAGAFTEVNMSLAANQPSFVNGTGVITLPAVTGVQWQVDGEDVADGAQPALGVGEEAYVEATPQSGYVLQGDTDWTYERV